MANPLSQLDPAELAKLPTINPPPGTIVDFNAPNPLERTVITVTSVFMGLAFLIVGIRAYTKIKLYRRGSWDDLTCTLGLISTFIYWIVVLLQVTNEGFGQHLWNVPLVLTISDAFLKLGYLSDWMISIPYIFIKLTFFILYWNIFKPFRWLRISIIGGTFAVTIVYLACLLAELIGATPLSGQTWRESSTGNNIGRKLAVPLAAWTLASDIYLLLLPISCVFQLQLSAQRRFGLLTIFMTGIGACVCSSLSLYYRTQYNEDVTFSVVKIQILIIVELCVGICISCMPSTSVFLRHTLPSMNSLRPKLSYYSNRLRSSLQLHQSHPSQGTPSHNGRAVGLDGPYQNLGEREMAASKEAYALYPTHGVKTTVVAHPFGDVSDDRIHLRVDLEQQ